MNDMSNRQDAESGMSRRRFLKTSAGLTLSLSQMGGAVSSLFVREALAAAEPVKYARWEDLYRKQWKWDKIAWGSHTNMCTPTACSFRVYVRDGIVWREEQAALNRASNPNYPDYNPNGCQKGCAYHNVLYEDHRVKYPMKRVGKRGESKWKRIGWDEALTEIADAHIDAIEKHGIETVIIDAPHGHMGTVGFSAAFKYGWLLGAVCPDFNVEIGDVFMGIFETMGKMHLGYTADNLLDAELIFLTNSNWSYTMPALYHFVTEARYNGSEVVTIAPDFSPTTIPADIHVPVKVGTDAAFWLGVCNVMLEENLYDAQFIREQTDLALLVRTDTGRFLRGSEVDASREDQLFFYDVKTSKVVKAPRGTLTFDGEQALTGRYRARLGDGTEVEVTPAFELLRAKLNEYAPENAAQMCRVPAPLIRELARKVAKKRTCSYIGFNSAKHYHGDLMERALLLAMALSGNWGKPGTGFNIWSFPADGLQLLAVMEKRMSRGGAAAMMQAETAIHERVMKEDREANAEIVSIRLAEQFTKQMGWVPPALFLHNHAGYKDLWNNKAWQDPAVTRGFTESIEEAIKKGWWTPDQLQPGPGKEPQVLLLIGHNPMRRLRHGQIQYPDVLFPKLKMLWTIEPRMSSSAAYCDIVLPAAWYYEKWDQTGCVTANPRFALIEQAVMPPGEAKPEWEIFAALFEKIGERAKARGLTAYPNRFGTGNIRYDQLYSRFTMEGEVKTQLDALKEVIFINSATGIIPKDFTLDKFRTVGQVELEGMGSSFLTELVASDYSSRKPFFSLGHHLQHKKIYPTYARRAQFYIDHPWFLEAGEALPTHKDVPPMGGNHPFMITGGHPRVSIHSVHLSSPHFLKLHRGQPVVHINAKVAAARGIKDGDRVKLFNDSSEVEIMARTSPAVAPDQVIVYFWEAYQFPKWNPYDNLFTGLPKALHLAGGYEQIGRYYMMNGSPSPASDRGTRVDVVKI